MRRFVPLHPEQAHETLTSLTINESRAVRTLSVKLATAAAIILTIAAIATLAKSDGSGPIHIENAWARPAWGKSGVTAGYATVVNKANLPDRLIAVSSDAAKAVELHASGLKDGISQMRRQNAFEVPAVGNLLFAPGGNHLMFIGLKEPAAEGDHISVTFTFEQAGTLTINMPVVKR